MDIQNCKKIQFFNDILIILDNNGKVYSSKNLKIFILIPVEEVIIDLVKVDAEVFLESQTKVWKVIDINCNLKSIDYNNYLLSTKLYYKTYNFKQKGYFFNKEIH